MKQVPYQENIDGEEVIIVADFTDLPGGGVDVEELIEGLQEDLMKDEVEKTVIHMSLLAWKNGDITMIELKKVLDKAQVEAVRAELELAQAGIVDSNHFTPEVTNTADGDYITIYRGKCFECHIKDRLDSLTKEDGETKRAKL